MASTITARKQLIRGEDTQGSAAGRSWVLQWFRLGVRTRQIALVTLLVAFVVALITLANTAYMTGVIISGTRDEAERLSSQIAYAVQQQIAHEVTVDQDVYHALASEKSSVRSLMESNIVTYRTITYLYITGASGRIVNDATGRNALAANGHMIGEIPSTRPDLSELAVGNRMTQLARVFLGQPIYELRRPLTTDDRSFIAELHIGVSAQVVRGELLSPIKTSLVIGIIAIVLAFIVALSSANLLIKPLKAISTSIDHLEHGGLSAFGDPRLRRDETVTGVTTRLRQLGERLAGERTELELMRGRLRQVISHLEERLLLINREGRVILASPDAERILGLGDIEITGLPVDETLGNDHPLVVLVEQSFRQRRSIARTTVHVQGTASPRQLIASLQYIEDVGEPVGVLVSLRDYESFQRFESQWDLSKKLADLGRITSGIAHEVKNPLNAMVIHLEILRSKLESGNGDAHPQMEILDAEIKRLDRVVQTFLNFTRPLEVRLEPVDLNSVVSQVVALASTAAQDSGITITRDILGGALVAKCDTDLLKQALLNIIINGCQAMPEGGPLKVATSREPDGSALITVTDRGVGIAPEGRDRIFNLYYTTKNGGTGIGLAQAFRAVQLHNGRIQFESEVGVGTTFKIVLPALN